MRAGNDEPHPYELEVALIEEIVGKEVLYRAVARIYLIKARNHGPVTYLYLPSRYMKTWCITFGPLKTRQDVTGTFKDIMDVISNPEWQRAYLPPKENDDDDDGQGSLPF